METTTYSWELERETQLMSMFSSPSPQIPITLNPMEHVQVSHLASRWLTASWWPLAGLK